ACQTGPNAGSVHVANIVGSKSGLFDTGIEPVLCQGHESTLQVLIPIAFFRQTEGLELLHRSELRVLGVLKKIVVGQAAIGLLHELAVGSMENNKVESINVHGRVDGSMRSGELGDIEVIAGVDRTSIAGVAKVTVHGGVLGTEVGFVKVPVV